LIDQKNTPETKSSDFEAMGGYWHMVSAMLGGAPAMRKAGQKYLPKFTNETQADYDVRLKSAKFTNIFVDIVSTIASKPFGKEVMIETNSARVEALLENIDGQGSHISIFAANSFYHGVGYSLDWIFVDFTKGVPDGATVAQEQAIGARPYWVHIPAQEMIAVYSEMIGGVETIIHARFEEEHVVRDGWGETEVERVRVLNREVSTDANGVRSAGPATWELWEERKNAGGIGEWFKIEEGAISIGVIPIVPFIAGRREGSSWRVKPPLEDAAYLQVEHYQQESGLKYAKELTAFPMLAGNGVNPPEGADGKPSPVPVGPKTVLYAPMNGDGEHGEWTFIEPNANSLRFLAEDIKATEAALRELGRQPLTAQSGNITTITAAFAGDKAHSVIEALALNFKDTLENALRLTALWLGEIDEPEVTIDTDFALALKDNDGTADLLEARKNGDLSQETLWDELKRRGKLSDNFDPEIERARLLEEAPSDPMEEETDAAMMAPADGSAIGRMPMAQGADAP